MTQEENNIALDKFKSLLHIDDTHKCTCQDWGYAPNLYHFDGCWHVSWIHCSEGDALYDFGAQTIEEVIDMAYTWFHRTFCNA